VALEKDQFQQSDVSFWGVVAMLGGAAAMLSLTFAAILPPSFVGGLHASRLPGSSLNQLRAQMARLSDTQSQMLDQTRELRSRLAITERGRKAVVRRVGALETTIPMLLEVVPPGSEIDPLTTASIQDPGEVKFEAEGGYVTVTRRPLFASPETQPLPPPLAQGKNGMKQTAPGNLPAGSLPDKVTKPDQTLYGIAIGRVLKQGNAKEVWQDLSAKIGMLLIGLDPSVYDPLQNGKNRIIAGPVDDLAEAEMLCRKITVVGIDCLPVQYKTDALLPL